MEKTINQTNKTGRKTDSVEKPGFIKAFEARETTINKVLETFDIDAFTAEVGVTKTVTVPGAGAVQYQLLSYDEHHALLDKLDVKIGLRDRGLHVIAEMMFRADGKTSFEKLKALPAGISNKIVDEIGKQAGFL